MRKALGHLIWRQSRDISVLNYPSVTVFEIFTNQGTLRIAQDKTTSALFKVEEPAVFTPVATLIPTKQLPEPELR